MKLHFTFILATLAASSAYIGGRPPTNQDLDPHFYCGRKLARMLATVCDYNEKRSGSGGMMHPILNSYYKAQQEYGWPYVTSQKLKDKESYKLLHKMHSQTDWPQESEVQYMGPLKAGSYGLFSQKTKESGDWPVRKAQDTEYLPWLSPHKARGLDLPSRSKRFVVSECCEKPCTLDELITYC